MSQAMKDMVEAEVEALCQQFADNEIGHDQFYRRMQKLGFSYKEAGEIASNFNPQ